jgi:hypothetical protein
MQVHVAGEMEEALEALLRDWWISVRRGVNERAVSISTAPLYFTGPGVFRRRAFFFPGAAFAPADDGLMAVTAWVALRSAACDIAGEGIVMKGKRP